MKFIWLIIVSRTLGFDAESLVKSETNILYYRPLKHSFWIWFWLCLAPHPNSSGSSVLRSPQPQSKDV